MDDQELYDELQPLVSQVAIQVHRQFYYTLEREDVAQLAWEFVFTRKKKVLEYLEGEEIGKLVVSMTNFAKKKCLREKSIQDGWDFDDLAWYNKKGIETVLTAMFDEDAWTEPPVSDNGGGSGGDPAYGGNWIATLADVSRAFDRLDEEERLLLTYLYRDEMTHREAADLLDVDHSTVTRRNDKALERLLEILGGPYPSTDEPDPEYTGRRRTKTNNQAMAETRNQYGE